MFKMCELRVIRTFKKKLIPGSHAAHFELQNAIGLRFSILLAGVRNLSCANHNQQFIHIKMILRVDCTRYNIGTFLHLSQGNINHSYQPIKPGLQIASRRNSNQTA